jgi:phage terminase large subunit
LVYFTSTYYKIQAITKKIKVIQGGQGAGKNVSICQILIKKATEKKRIITVMTDTYDNLKDGAIKDFRDQFEAMGWDWERAYNKTDKDLRIGQSVVQFRYITDAKSTAGKSKRRDILYINEANKIGWNVASTYIGRTHEDVYIDYNPDFEFWAHTEIPLLVDQETGEIISEQIIVTYLDNEKLPQGEIDYIESRKSNEEWYRVYGLGLTGTYSDRRIYKFTIIKEIPEGVKRVPDGMDFGQSPDPTVRIKCYNKGANLYLHQCWSMNNLMPEKIQGAERPSIVDRMNEDAIAYAKSIIPAEHFIKDDEYYCDARSAPRGQPIPPEEVKIRQAIQTFKNWQIVGDSSGRVELLDLSKWGYTVRGVVKGPQSQYTGIKKMRAYNIFVTEESTELIKGFESWFWKVDQNGKIIPEPDGHEPDGLAAARYVCMTSHIW